MNYHQVIINESGLNTNGTLGDSHFSNTSYPSVSLTKGGTMSKTRLLKVSEYPCSNWSEFKNKYLYFGHNLWGYYGEFTNDHIINYEVLGISINKIFELIMRKIRPYKTMGQLKTKKDYLIDDIFENQMRNWFKYFPSCGQSFKIVDNGKKVIITISNIKRVKKYPFEKEVV